MDVPENLTSGDLEVVAQRLDVDNEVVDRALEVVRQFIADKGLILYGGLAIDYTLRLKGGHIYPEGERPDYDMLSPQNVEHAYELADILAEKGFPSVQAIPALHVQTMRVRVNVVVVADISFAPESLFRALPTVAYPGNSSASGAPIRVIHPHWQFMDQHLAFCFPFRDPPMEPVFHRFGKDLKRFNLLQGKYPLPPAKPTKPAVPGPVSVTLPLLKDCALHGDSALTILQHQVACLKAVGKPSSTAAPFQVAEKEDRVEVTVKQECPHGVVVSCLIDPLRALNQMGYTLKRTFRPLLDVLPVVLEGELAGGASPQTKGYPKKMFLFNHPARLLSATVVDTSEKGRAIHMVSPQYVMMHYLLGYHSAGASEVSTVIPQIWEGADAQFFLGRYQKTLGLLNEGAKLLHEAIQNGRHDFPHTCQLEQSTPFSLSAHTIGSHNYGEAQLIIAAGDVRSAKVVPKDPVLAELIPQKEELSRLPRRYAPGSSGGPGWKGLKMDHLELPWFKWDGGVSE